MENPGNYIKKIFYKDAELDDYQEESTEDFQEPITIVKKQHMDISIIVPTDFTGAKLHAGEIIAGKTVIACFDKLSAEDRQRVYDYMNGVAYTVSADIRIIAQNILLYVPQNVKVERLRLLSGRK